MIDSHNEAFEVKQYLVQAKPLVTACSIIVEAWLAMYHGHPLFTIEPRAWEGGVAFTRYCYYHYGMVYGIQTGGRREGRILTNSRAIALHQDGQCRWAG